MMDCSSYDGPLCDMPYHNTDSFESYWFEQYLPVTDSWVGSELLNTLHTHKYILIHIWLYIIIYIYICIDIIYTCIGKSIDIRSMIFSVPSCPTHLWIYIYMYFNSIFTTYMYVLLGDATRASIKIHQSVSMVTPYWIHLWVEISAIAIYKMHCSDNNA